MTEAFRIPPGYRKAIREGPDIVSVAAAIGDPARGAMLTALLRIPLLTVGELAYEAGVTAQTASGHLRQLCDAGLLNVAARGRHRYYRLGDERVAQLLEQLLGLAEHLGHTRTRPGPKDAALRRARTCYDHMAGSLAVELFQRMRNAGFFVFSADEIAAVCSAVMFSSFPAKNIAAAITTERL